MFLFGKEVIFLDLLERSEKFIKIIIFYPLTQNIEYSSSYIVLLGIYLKLVFHII